MKKNMFLVTILVSSLVSAQVGVNTVHPKATLDVMKGISATLPEGIIAPRLTGDEIKERDGLYNVTQKGAILYATSGVGAASIKTAGITDEGYYYFDGLAWMKMGNNNEPWYNQADGKPAKDNTQNIYQTGNVSIGSQIPIIPFVSNGIMITPKLSVKGDMAATGAFYTTTGKYADYVFEDYFDGKSKINEAYKFKSLKEIDEYIKKNRHLPGVTSIKDVLKSNIGYSYNLSELSIQQLEKIEELYLHVINQQKQIETLKEQLTEIEFLLPKKNTN
ncbi:hypothetical protein [Chryseobacterium sp. G0201]|uniref:hypothetical protein n=1 Tax=Chryseobacterium sp. G0201 TaxID=2487065 RepID=UPI000F4D4E06|nr:hypothetical protein [Chryseobacterium sp. G0201]AZA53964.1 hypothetical protein EG348_13610 [Chryseobacterium sp. G0201]